MLVNDFIGSDFMKAADLGQTTPQVTVSKVEPVDFQDGTKKLALHPSDPQMKPIVLNVTNTRAMAAAFGPESDAWLGKTVMLSVRQTQMGPGIGVTPLQAPNQPITQPHPDFAPGAGQGSFTPGAYQAPSQPDGTPFDDDIPFGNAPPQANNSR